MTEQTPQRFSEQYLLFDHTEYIVGIKHIGQVALIELIETGVSPEENKAEKISAPHTYGDGTLFAIEDC